MRTLEDLSPRELNNALRTYGLRLRVGPYVYAIQSPVAAVREGLTCLYRDFPVAAVERFADYHITLRAPNTVQWLRRRLDFYFDGRCPFNRIEYSHAYAFLEWGMNWCVSVTANEYLKLHAAVVAKDGMAIVMPGLPGAGKSTLCAALALAGWRVLSDEHALVIPGTSKIVPLCRPISLKNASIDLVRSLDSRVVLGPKSHDTHKGMVAHMKADLTPDSHDGSPVQAQVLVFPEYTPETRCSISKRSRAESFMFAAHHSFNYSLLGERGFEAMRTLIDSLDCYGLRYSDLDVALSAIERLHAAQSATT